MSATSSLDAVRAFAGQIAGTTIDPGLPVPATPPDPRAADRRDAVGKAVKFARRLERLKAAGDIDWAPQTRELLAFDTVARTFSALVAVRNLYGIACQETGDPDRLAAELEAQFGPGTATALELQGTGPQPQTITRPDATEYVCRRIAGVTDVAFLRACRAHGLFVRLYGAPGTGKTALTEAAFGGELLTTECDEGTSTEQVVGGWVPTPDGGFAWRDGDLTACLKGTAIDGSARRVWFADDITAAPANVLARTYPALDGRGRLTVKEHLGETVTAGDGFYAVCAYNPDLPGCEFPAPLRSRFQVAVRVPTDYDTVTRLCQ